MTQVQSNAHRVEIVLANNQLAALAASLAPNTWGSLNTNGLTSAMLTVGDSDNIISFCPRGQWDPIHHIGYFFGGTHEGAGGHKRYIRYVAATNTWEVEEDGGAETATSPRHGYNHFVVRPSDAKFFQHLYGGPSNMTRAQGSPGSWTSIANNPGSLFGEWNIIVGASWFPELYSGQGGLCLGTGSWSASWQESANAWTTRSSQTLTASTAPWSAYNPLDQRFYWGNGDTTMFAMAPDGSVSQRANLPFACSVEGGNSITNPAQWDGRIHAGATGKLLAISGAGSVREYTLSSNSWSGQISTLPFSFYDNGIVGIPIPEYGVIMFFFLTGSNTPSTTVWLFKH